MKKVKTPEEKNDMFPNLISTDTQNEFVDNFWTMIDFYKKFIWGEQRYFKRTTISLHMTLYSLFVLFLERCSNNIIWVRRDYISETNTVKQNKNIADKYKWWFQNTKLEQERQNLIWLLDSLKDTKLTDEDKKKIRQNIYDNEVYGFVNKWVDIANFTELRDRVKKTVDGKYWINVNLSDKVIVDQRDKIINIVNASRNTFIHFEPQSYSTRVSDTFDIGKWCLDIVYHILSNCKINDDMTGTNVVVFFLYDIDVEKMKTAILEINKNPTLIAC